MSYPAPGIVTVMTLGKRKIAVAAAVTALATAGLWAGLAAAAPAAGAATVVTGGLDVNVVPGSVEVGLGTVEATITYTCTDTAAPGGQAALRVTFDQNNNDASGETAVPCGTGQVNKTKTVTAVQVGMSGSQEITAEATLTDRTATASGTADAETSQIYLHLDPTATYPGHGTVTLTGFYNCAPDFPTPAKIIVTAEQDNASNIATAGSALVTITTCNNASQAFSVTITGTLTGDQYQSSVSTSVDAAVISAFNSQLPGTQDLAANLF